jgi:ABC-type transport system involved in cytochrome c biogenesis permease subunit
MKRLLLLALSLIFTASTYAVDLGIIEKLPVQDAGRKKPFYVFAIEIMQKIHGDTTFEEKDKTWEPSETLASIWFTPEKWSSKPFIYVENLEFRKKLGMDEKDKYVSFDTLAQSQELLRLADEAEKLKSQNPQAKLSSEQEVARKVYIRAQIFSQLLQGIHYNIIPPPEGNQTDRWIPAPQAATYYPNELGELATKLHQELKEAYQKNDSAAFFEKGYELYHLLPTLNPQVYPSVAKMDLERSYFHFHPFRIAWVLYLAALVVLVLTTLIYREMGYKIAWSLVGLGFALQLVGFICRVIVTGRAPVTNMYETIVWLSFGVIFFSIVLEAIYKCRHYLIGALPIAIVALVLADSQPQMLNPAMDPLVPVLRSNFWLTIHVLTITSSYAAFALALGVAHIIYFKLLLPGLEKPTPQLYNYLYRALQIGVLLLATGTILGGVWANYSWGRFWGWDPKETWALIALLCYLFVLHGRITGWWNQIGLTVGAVLCFQAVVMAWYGVNFVLGTGLHSYGFGAGGLEYIVGFVTVELILTAIVLIKTKTTGKA